ncbi:MAG: DUF6364 family protein [Eggerthellaceae bacterium]|nr:DUF6364 family protein [Eggerthellaceae bacterium]
MSVELTLCLDEKAVEKGKRFALQQNSSLSQLVENYFNLLDSSSLEEIPVSQKLQSLAGIGSGGSAEDDYRVHLEGKHER